MLGGGGVGEGYTRAVIGVGVVTSGLSRCLWKNGLCKWECLAGLGSGGRGRVQADCGGSHWGGEVYRDEWHGQPGGLVMAGDATG